MSEEGIQKIAKKLAQHEAQRPLRDYKDEQLKLIQGENAAKEVIFRAVERWTGHPIEGKRLPIICGGQFKGYEPGFAPLFGPGPEYEIVSGLWAEDAQILKRRLESYDALYEALGSATQALCDLDVPSSVRLLPGQYPDDGRLEHKILYSIGYVNSFLLSAAGLEASLEKAIEETKGELNSREEKLGRPRVEARYRVAEAFAKLYAKVTGERPTYSQDPNGYHGKFSPELRNLFNAIGWDKVDLKGPATKACEAVTDDDLRWGENAFPNGLSGLVPD